MTSEKIYLKEHYDIKTDANITTYIREMTAETAGYYQNMPALIVVPGGGYSMVSDREGEPIAIEFLNRGYNTFVLKYSVSPARYPTALTELAAAVDYVRKNAKRFFVNPDRIFAIGFSAGGHLSANLANFQNTSAPKLLKGVTLDCKLNGLALGYPVITKDSHIGSFKNLLGITDVMENPKAEELSLENSVTKDNPPTFIWTTSTDACVNPIATVLYAGALIKHKVKMECHIFPEGEHGAALCDERTGDNSGNIVPRAQIWPELADKFFKSVK